MRILQRFGGEDLAQSTVSDDDANVWTAGPAYALMQAAVASSLAAATLNAQFPSWRYDEAAMPIAAPTIVVEDDAPPRPVFDEQRLTVAVRSFGSDDDTPLLSAPFGAESEIYRVASPDWPALRIAPQWSWDDDPALPLSIAGVPDEGAWIPRIPDAQPAILAGWRFDSSEIVSTVAGAPEELGLVPPIPVVITIRPPFRDEDAAASLYVPSEPERWPVIAAPWVAAQPIPRWDDDVVPQTPGPALEEYYRWPRFIASSYLVPARWAFDEQTPVLGIVIRIRGRRRISQRYREQLPLAPPRHMGRPFDVDG